MLIMIHGTGDDSTKTENWIRWVAELEMSDDKHVLVLPGVGSSMQGQLIDIGNDFLSSFLTRFPEQKRQLPSLPRIQRLDQSIRAATSARSEFGPIVNLNSGSDLQIVLTQIKDKFIARGKENGLTAIGIKSRAAVAALCAVAYYTHLDEEPEIIRLIGHSRGGSAVIAAHNLLRFHGLSKVKTLALDPCHGVKKFGAKEYTHVIYSGTVTSIPVVKEVGTGHTTLMYTLRQPITIGPGADPSALCYNTPKLQQIEHGHMGKLERFSKPGKIESFLKLQSAKAKRDRKTNRTREIQTQVGNILWNDQPLYEKVVELFKMSEDNKGDLRDKKVIHEYVLWCLFSQDMSLHENLKSLPCKALIDEYQAINRSNLGTPEDKQTTVTKLHHLLLNEPEKGINVVRALVKFKLARKGWKTDEMKQDSALFEVWNELYQSLGEAEEAPNAQKSTLSQTVEPPSFRNLLELVRNRSTLFAKEIPQTFKDFLKSLDQATLKRVVNGNVAIRNFLVSNDVPC